MHKPLDENQNIEDPLNKLKSTSKRSCQLPQFLIFWHLSRKLFFSRNIELLPEYVQINENCLWRGWKNYLLFLVIQNSHFGTGIVNKKSAWRKLHEEWNFQAMGTTIKNYKSWSAAKATSTNGTSPNPVKINGQVEYIQCQGCVSLSFFSILSFANP